ncbi:M14 family zinc carboxypeptidase [Nocardia sp. NPDC004278]
MREARFAEQAEAIAVRPDLRREIATAELMWRWVDYLADGYGIDPEATSVLDSTEVWIVPVADPDGVDIVSAAEGRPGFRRKNVDNTGPTCATEDPGNGRGVDLERNFSGRWSAEGADADPCAQDYRGVAAASPTLPPDCSSTCTPSEISDHGSGDRTRGRCPAAESGREDCTGGFHLGHLPGHRRLSDLGNQHRPGLPRAGVAALVMEIGPETADCAGFFPEYSCVDRLLWPQVGQVFTAAAGAAAAPYRQ